VAGGAGRRSLGVDAERRTWFEVAAVNPERFLALRAPIDMLGGRPFDTASPRPRAYNDTLWCFQLKELPGERTRLVVSGYAAARPRVLAAVQNVLFWEPAHWIMQTRQFANLKRRAEGWTTPRVSTSTGFRSEPVVTS
jgi:proline iminopeptidase